MHVVGKSTLQSKYITICSTRASTGALSVYLLRKVSHKKRLVLAGLAGRYGLDELRFFMKRILLFSLVQLLLTSYAMASDIQNVKLERLMVDTAHGDKLFVKVSGAAPQGPECSINGTWQYVLALDTELKKGTMTSFLLSAYMSGSSDRLIGTDSCEVYGSIETLRRIEFLN